MTDKTPLALLPGLLCDAALWSHQAAHLSDVADIRVADFTTQDNIPDMARHVLDIAPGETFAMAGLSMGGYVALEVMRQAPERVERLALLDTAANADTPEQTERRQALLSMSRHGKFRGVTPRLLPLLVHPDRQEDEGLVGPIMAMAERVGSEAFLRQQTAIVGRDAKYDVLGDIRCPTVVICGRQDILTPPERSEELAADIPGAALVMIEDCGHMSAMERPQAVTALLRYWLAR